MGIKKNEILQETQILVLHVWAQRNVTGYNFTKIFRKNINDNTHCKNTSGFNFLK